ncbi:MAG TPA: hypothetical protein P5526_20230 [Anaerolineae bacterium]|nr:hypothetical protein [Anaerolineae bacterium]
MTVTVFIQAFDTAPGEGRSSNLKPGLSYYRLCEYNTAIDFNVIGSFRSPQSTKSSNRQILPQTQFNKNYMAALAALAENLHLRVFGQTWRCPSKYRGLLPN